MTILSEQALDRFSNWIERTILKDNCTILRETTTTLPSGGRRVTFIPQAETEKCAILDAGNPTEQLVAAQTVGSIPKLILFKRSVTILGTDRLRVNGIEYHVIDNLDPSTYQVVTRISVRRASLQGGA